MFSLALSVIVITCRKENESSPNKQCSILSGRHSESSNWFLLHCVSRPGRSIVRKNTQPKETRPWHITRAGGGGGEKGLAQCQSTQSSALELKQEDFDILRLGIDRILSISFARIEVIG